MSAWSLSSPPLLALLRFLSRHRAREREKAGGALCVWGRGGERFAHTRAGPSTCMPFGVHTRSRVCACTHAHTHMHRGHWCTELTGALYVSRRQGSRTRTRTRSPTHRPRSSTSLLSPLVSTSVVPSCFSCTLITRCTMGISLPSILNTTISPTLKGELPSHKNKMSPL